MCCASQRESVHSLFINTTTSEAKETIIIEDESEDDDTEELYQARKFVLLPDNISFVQTEF